MNYFRERINAELATMLLMGFTPQCRKCGAFTIRRAGYLVCPDNEKHPKKKIPKEAML
jgi:uncharacterized Zn finger protein (UPF0148 family)